MKNATVKEMKIKKKLIQKRSNYALFTSHLGKNKY
jgi:hypothetical protein